VFFPKGDYRITDTLHPQQLTKFIGEEAGTGQFVSFISRITYDPPAAIKSTLSANINNTAATIGLSDASSFPESGIIYIDGVNGEYVKYTGKSGNSLTGCTRGYWGGTGATSKTSPSGIGENYSSGDSVWLLRPAIMRDGVYGGTIQNIGLYHNGFVDNATGWDDLGVGLYFNYTAYATILRDSLLHGFEKALYCGRSYVTTLEHPMIYRCLYGAQMDVPNGVVINNSDSGQIGSDTLLLTGWCYYFKNGESPLVVGGNIGNGNYNVPIISDGCKPVTVNGIYVEAHKVELFKAINGGVIYADGIYSKESTFRFASIETEGKIFINNMYHRNTTATTPWVFNTDNTGSWWIKNSFNGDSDTYDPDKYGIGTDRYEIPHFTQSNSPIFSTEQRGVKDVPDNTAIELFKIRTRALSGTDTRVGLTVDYFVAGNWDSGAVSEKGILEVAIHHRSTLAPVTALTKVGETQTTVVGSTRTVTFTATTSLIATNTYETTINLTSVASNAAASNITYVVKPSNLNLVSNFNQGLLTIL